MDTTDEGQKCDVNAALEAVRTVLLKEVVHSLLRYPQFLGSLLLE